ncbi:MAG: hypothetical protein IPH88_18140 [Bacteroidales bacterium]|nr:hypothetical protein [Bacteroidales bacterium]
MKKELNPLDEFFRDSLEDVRVEPSASAKARFLEEASAPGGISGTGWFRLYHLFIIAGMVITGVLLIFLLRTPKTTAINPVAAVTPEANTPSIPATNSEQQTSIISENNNASNPSRVITDEPSRRIDAKVSSVVKPSETIKSKINKTTTQKEQNPEIIAPVKLTPASKGNTSIPKENKAIPAIENTVNVTANSEKTDLLPPSSAPSESNPSATPEVKGGDAEPAYNPASDKNESSNAAGNPSPKPESPKKSKKPSQIKFEPGFRYNIDLPLDGSNAEPVHSLNVEGKVYWGKFYIYSGAGYALTNGFHQYEVKYNDYLGQYKKLDSITFAWDQKHYHLMPSYYMTETDVYDSSLQIDYYSLQKRYTRIRIPLMIGYDFYQKGRFSFGVQAGAEWDIFAGAREKEGSYSAGTKKIISVNGLSDELSKNRLFLIADFSVACQLSKRIYLLAEPRLNYLIPSSTSAGSQSGQDISPMFRGSLLIKF